MSDTEQKLSGGDIFEFCASKLLTSLTEQTEMLANFDMAILSEAAQRNQHIIYLKAVNPSATAEAEDKMRERLVEYGAKSVTITQLKAGDWESLTEYALRYVDKEGTSLIISGYFLTYNAHTNALRNMQALAKNCPQLMKGLAR